MTDDMDRGRKVLIEEVEIVHGEVGNIPQPGRVVRTAKAGMFGDGQRVAMGQALKKRQPRGPAPGAVQKQRGRSGAGAPHPHADAAGDEAVRSLSHDTKLTLLARR